MSSKKKIAFLLNSKDIHSTDWLKCALKVLNPEEVYMLTDISDMSLFDGFSISESNIIKLYPVNNLLFMKGTVLGDIWRNFIKLLVLPLQVLRLKRFCSSHKDTTIYAIAMYYMYLAKMAKVHYGGTPIGSELLVRPQKSKMYRKFAKTALKGASFVTVDSPAMADKAMEIAGVKPEIIQNGINLPEIEEFVRRSEKNKGERSNMFLSVRSIDYLYRVLGIILERNQSKKYNKVPIQFIYPFYNEDYLEDCRKAASTEDVFLGRLNREEMYRLLANTKIVFSIPKSDSSPRSVYESIFLGCVTIVSKNKYYDLLPKCMQQRIVLVDINDNDWFDKSVEKAIEISKKPFEPTQDAIEMFDQNMSFKKIYQLLQNIH